LLLHLSAALRILWLFGELYDQCEEKWVISFSGAHKTVERPSAAPHPSSLFIRALCCDYDSRKHSSLYCLLEGYGILVLNQFAGFIWARL
jgi:hypothetical protein